MKQKLLTLFVLALDLLFILSSFPGAKAAWSCNNCNLPEYMQELYRRGYCSDRKEDTASLEFLSSDFIALNYSSSDYLQQNQLLILFKDLISVTYRIFEDLEPRQKQGMLLNNTIFSRLMGHNYTRGVLRAASTTIDEAPNNVYVLTDADYYRLSENNNISRLDSNDISVCISQSSRCFLNQHNLLDIAVVPRSQTRPSYIIAFYGEKFLNSSSSYRRDYEVKVWQNMYDLNEQIEHYATAVTGYLTGAEIYNFTNDEFRGFYTTTDGEVCHFVKQFRTNSRTNFLFEDTSVPRKPCFPIQIFIGCPMPWCSEIRFETSFTVRHPVSNRNTIFFKKLQFYWKVNDTELPLDTPRVEDAIYIEDQDLDDPDFCTGTGLANFSDPCILAHAEIIYGLSFRGNQYIFMSEAIHQKLYFLPYPPVAGAVRMYYPRLSYDLKDSMWFNAFENSVYEFYQSTYEKSPLLYTHNYPNLGSAVHGNLSQLGIEHGPIDAVVSRRGVGYMFVGSFFYAIPEYATNFTGRLPKVLAIEGFFNILDACYQNKSELYETLLRRHKGTYVVSSTTSTDVTEITGVDSRRSSSEVTFARPLTNETRDPGTLSVALVTVMLVVSCVILVTLIVLAVNRHLNVGRTAIAANNSPKLRLTSSSSSTSGESQDTTSYASKN